MKPSLSVLIVEDIEDDAHLLLLELKRHYEVAWQRVETADEMKRALQDRPWDIIIADYVLPQFSGLAALKLSQDLETDIPFILVSGTIGEEVAVQAMKAGAHDYIMKGNLQRLIPAVERELREAQIRRQQQISERKLRESEERFRQMADNINQIFWLNSVDTKEVYYVSPAFEEVYGYAKDTIYENPQIMSDAIHPEDKERIQFVLTKQHREATSEEFRVIRADGSTRWVRMRSFPIKDDAGEVYRIAGITEDITEQKKSAEALLESENRYYKLFENMREAFIAINNEDRIITANPAAATLLGFSNATKLLNFKSSHLYKDVQQQKAILEELSKKGYAENFEAVFKKQDGSDVLVHILGNAILSRNKRQKSESIEIIFSDISDRKQLEEQLIQAQKMEAIGRLAGGVAHDFNNILTVILGNAAFGQQLCSSDDPINEEFSGIQKAAKQASALTSQLLAFSRRQLLNPQVVNLNPVIENHVKMLGRIIGDDIKLATELAPHLRPIWADPAQLQQVLMNMSVNARDAMLHGGEIIIKTRACSPNDRFLIEQIKLNAKSSKNHFPEDFIQVSISDTGTGMEVETMTHIFEPFFTTKEIGKGTGLGLAVAYGIIKQHEGYVDVDSVVNRGTTFRIYFPVLHQKQQIKMEKQTQKPIPTGVETVLIVEDEETVRNVTMRILKGLGYGVITAKDGSAAVELFQKNHINVDLIILDVVMPGLSGPKTYDKLSEVMPDLPVIFVTGYDVDSEIEEIDETKLEKTNVLHKPYTRETLGRMVREVLDANK